MSGCETGTVQFCLFVWFRLHVTCTTVGYGPTASSVYYVLIQCTYVGRHFRRSGEKHLLHNPHEQHVFACAESRGVQRDVSNAYSHYLLDNVHLPLTGLSLHDGIQFAFQPDFRYRTESAVSSH